MYATKLKDWLDRNRNLTLLTLGDTRMKKIFLALLLCLAGAAYADPTNTPTVTLTPTPTPTFTPTRTNTPVNSLDGQKGRVIVQAGEFLLTDGVSRPATTPVPGSANIWLAQALSYTSAVFATNTASARIQLTVPADYMRGGSLWLHAYNATLTNTVQIRADVAKVSIGALTSTATVFNGVTTNVQTQFTGPLLGARYSRVWIPLSGTVGTYGTLKSGDLLNINIIRSGASGDLNVFAAEFEYAVNYPYRP
jgi:hypothetical protein